MYVSANFGSLTSVTSFAPLTYFSFHVLPHKPLRDHFDGRNWSLMSESVNSRENGELQRSWDDWSGVSQGNITKDGVAFVWK